MRAAICVLVLLSVKLRSLALIQLAKHQACQHCIKAAEAKPMPCPEHTCAKDVYCMLNCPLCSRVDSS